MGRHDPEGLWDWPWSALVAPMNSWNAPHLDDAGVVVQARTRLKFGGGIAFTEVVPVQTDNAGNWLFHHGRGRDSDTLIKVEKYDAIVGPEGAFLWIAGEYKPWTGSFADAEGGRSMPRAYATQSQYIPWHPDYETNRRATRILLGSGNPVESVGMALGATRAGLTGEDRSALMEHGADSFAVAGLVFEAAAAASARRGSRGTYGPMARRSRGGASARSDGGAPVGYSRRVQTAGDVTMRTEAAARREAMRRWGAVLSEPNAFSHTPDPTRNPNIRGPRGKPGEVLEFKVGDSPVRVQHHKYGHEFKDNETFEHPHYHGPSGEHISYTRR